MQAENRRIYTTCFLAAAAVGIGYLCFQILGPFLAAIAWAVVLAVAFHPPWLFLQRKLGPRRNLAAGTLTLAIGLLVLLPTGLLIGVVASQVNEVAGVVTAKLTAAHLRSFQDVIQLPTVAQALDSLKARVGVSPEAFQQGASAAAKKAVAMLPGLSAKVALGAFDALGTFLMTLFLLFFFIRDGEALARATLELLPTGNEQRAALARTFRTMLQAIFRGSLLCALAQGATGALGWWVAGLPLPTLAGAAMAVLSLLPVGGTAIVWLPGVVWAWIAGRHGGAIFLLVWGLLVVSFLADNVLRPFLMQGARELAPLVVILGVFGGMAAFGVLGLFIGPLALVLAVVALDVLRAQAAGGETAV